MNAKYPLFILSLLKMKQNLQTFYWGHIFYNVTISSFEKCYDI